MSVVFFLYNLNKQISLEIVKNVTSYFSLAVGMYALETSIFPEFRCMKEEICTFFTLQRSSLSVQLFDITSILIKHESCLSVCLLSVFRSQVPWSWNFVSRPNVGQLRSLRSPIFEIWILRGVPYGPVLKKKVFRVVFFKNLSHFNT